MVTTGRSQLLGAVCFWLVAVLLARWAWDATVTAPARGPDGVAADPCLKIQLAPAHSPCGQALREARTEWIRAREATARELELSPEAGPDGVIWHVTDAHRQYLMSLDRSGALGRARRAARRAAMLARTPSERWHAAELMARLECNAGHHRAEMQYARRLIALRPQQRGSWETLKHAAVCNGDSWLVQQADKTLEGLPIARASPP